MSVATQTQASMDEVRVRPLSRHRLGVGFWMPVAWVVLVTLLAATAGLLPIREAGGRAVE